MGGEQLFPWRWVGPWTAPHEETKVLIDMPKEFFDGTYRTTAEDGEPSSKRMPADAQLQLGFAVGGGGGHSLHIRSASLLLEKVVKVFQAVPAGDDFQLTSMA